MTFGMRINVHLPWITHLCPESKTFSIMLVIRFIIYFLIYGENKDIFEWNAHVIQFYAEAPFFVQFEFEIAAVNEMCDEGVMI